MSHNDDVEIKNEMVKRSDVNVSAITTQVKAYIKTYVRVLEE